MTKTKVAPFYLGHGVGPTCTSPELLSTGMLFLTQPIQRHLLIPSVQHPTDYPPLHPTPTASSMTLGINGLTPMAGYLTKNRRM